LPKGWQIAKHFLSHLPNVYRSPGAGSVRTGPAPFPSVLENRQRRRLRAGVNSVRTGPAGCARSPNLPGPGP